MPAEPISHMSTAAIWWWRGLLVCLVLLTIVQMLAGQLGILCIWAVPLYQLPRMTPELRRKLLTGRAS